MGIMQGDKGIFAVFVICELLHQESVCGEEEGRESLKPLICS